jgi:hypothetical protein
MWKTMTDRVEVRTVNYGMLAELQFCTENVLLSWVKNISEHSFEVQFGMIHNSCLGWSRICPVSRNI